MREMINALIEETSPVKGWLIFLLLLALTVVGLAYVGGFVVWGFLNFLGFEVSYWNALWGYVLTYLLVLILPFRK